MKYFILIYQTNHIPEEKKTTTTKVINNYYYNHSCNHIKCTRHKRSMSFFFCEKEEKEMNETFE